MADNAFDIKIDEKEFTDNIKAMERMHDAITPKWIKATKRRKLKPMVTAMKSSAQGYIGSSRIAKMIGVTTAKKRAGALGAKVGVVKNDTSLFPKFSAPALASVIEYGTGERKRTLKAGVFVTGQQSTGRMPAMPFLRPQWDSHVKGFMNDMERSIEDKVMKEAK